MDRQLFMWWQINYFTSHIFDFMKNFGKCLVIFMYTYYFKLRHTTAQTSHSYGFTIMIQFTVYIKKLLYKKARIG